VEGNNHGLKLSVINQLLMRGPTGHAGTHAGLIEGLCLNFV
jgi:hypothetical protein